MKVKVYSTPTCPYCKRVKEFLEENNVDFTDVDVSVNREAVQEMIDKSGQMGVPVIEIDDEIIIGFDKQKIKEVLNL